MALVVRHIRCIPVICLSVLRCRQRLDLRLQHSDCAVLGGYQFAIDLRLDCGLFVVFGVVRLDQIGRLGPFTDGNHGLVECINRSFAGRLQAYNATQHGLHYACRHQDLIECHILFSRGHTFQLCSLVRCLSLNLLYTLWKSDSVQYFFIRPCPYDNNNINIIDTDAF